MTDRQNSLKKRYRYLPKYGLNAREAALCILLSVTEEGEKANNCLADHLRESSLSPKDRALVTAIVDGTLDYLIRIDHILSGYSRKPLRFMNAEAKGILRMSVYQILFLDRIPDSAACNEAVEIAKRRGLGGLSGFINAVLRNLIRDKEKDPGKFSEFSDEHIRYSVPKWLYKRIVTEFGHDRAEDIFSAWLEKRGLTVRLNTSLMDEKDILSMLDEDGASYEKIDMEFLLRNHGIDIPERFIPHVYKLSGVFGVTSLSAFQKGLIAVQDPASTLPAAMACPEEGSTIIDVCAAPGGKALQLCDLLRGTGLVEARDVSEQKIGLIKENADRMGFKNLRISCADALTPDEDSYYRADIVMADLPCSGLGIVGRKPDIKLNIKNYSIEELKELQREMLTLVSRYVKPHGRLIYSTCTITREEDEDNAVWAATHLGFKLESSIKILPSKDHDGFFVAVLRKEFV